MSSAGVAMKRLHDALQHDQAGRGADALRAATEALAAFGEAGDRTGAAAAHHLLASLHEERGDRGPAIEHAEAGASLREATGDYEGLIPLLHLMLHLADGEREATVALAARALRAYERVGDRERIATGILQIARLLLAVGALDEMVPLLERGLWFSDRAGEERARCALLQLSAQRELQLGRSERAVRVGQEAVTLARQAGARPLLADALHILGLCQEGAGEPARARATLEEALDLREVLREPMGRALELDALARVEAALGEAEALDRLSYLARIWGGELNDPMQELETLHRAGELAIGLSRGQRALAFAQRQLELARKLGSPELLAASWHVLGGRQVALGALEEAAESFSEAADARRAAGQDEAAAVAAGMLGQVLDALGRRAEATEVLQEAERELLRLCSPHLEGLREILRER